RGVGHPRVRQAAQDQRWHAERCGSALPRHLRQPQENLSQVGRLLLGLSERPHRRPGPTPASGRLDPPKTPTPPRPPTTPHNALRTIESNSPTPLEPHERSRHNNRRRARLTSSLLPTDEHDPQRKKASESLLSSYGAQGPYSHHDFRGNEKLQEVSKKVSHEI